MRFIIFILLLISLAGCSYLKPRHKDYSINKRTPIANSNLIAEQKQSIQNQQVNNVINEYRFNENFDDTPIEDISLNQLSPDYMEPTDIDYQVGLTEDLNVRHSKAKEVKLHEVQHRKHKKKSYPELSDIPKRKTSEIEHKKLIDNKKQELKKIEHKSKTAVKNNINSAKQSKKEVVSSARPSKIEIEAKLKQLQSNAVSSSVDAKDKLPQGSVETKTKVTDAQTSNKQPLPKIDLPSTSTVTKPLLSSNLGISTNKAQQPPAASQPLDNSVSIPKMPSIANIAPPVKPDTKAIAPTIPALPDVTTKPPLPNIVETNPSPSAITTPPAASVNVPITPPLPSTSTQVNPSMSTSSADASKSSPDSTMNKTIRVNKDQSVEVYNSGTILPPPLPPAMPSK